MLEVDEPTHLVTEEAPIQSSTEDLRAQEDVRPPLTDRAAAVVEINLDNPVPRKNNVSRTRPGTALNDVPQMVRSASDMSIGKSLKSFGGARAHNSRLGYRGATPQTSGLAEASSREAKTPRSRQGNKVTENRTAGKMNSLAKSYV